MMEKITREETAIYRYKIITPVLMVMDENADLSKIMKIKKEICGQNGISDRTLRRWLAEYKDGGFEGLKPMLRNSGSPNVIPNELIEEAILLRREVPSRSVAQIIEILELEGKAPVGFIKRTTLQDRLVERGYSSRQMKLYQQKSVAARRFARLERNDMWHSDIKYGPFLTINGERKQIYLVCFLDDATRYAVHAEFYDSFDQTIVEDCFRKAIIKEGLPKRVYFDNGKQYRTKWMERACAKLEIKLIYAKPYSPESTGKIERFNRTVDSFLEEVKLKNLKTLDGFNNYLKIWLQECYHNREHASLKTTPEIAYKTSKSALRFMPTETIASAFMRLEQRKVDKSGCISFGGKKYEVGVLYVGQRVDVVYDVSNTETLIIEHKNSGTTFQVKELKIGVHTGARPRLPKSMTTALPQTSRLLDEKEKQYQAKGEVRRRAIRFNGLETGTGGEPLV